MALKRSEIELLSNRYSKAIFLAAKSASKLDEVNKELRAVADLISSDAQFAGLITGGALSKDKMTGIFTEVAKTAGFSDITRNTINILIENGRIGVIPQVSSKLAHLILENNNTAVVQVISAKSLSDSFVEKLTATLEKNTGKKIVCEQIVDENIIGGLKIKIGSVLFDDSISAKLETLKLNLAA